LHSIFSIYCQRTGTPRQPVEQQYSEVRVGGKSEKGGGWGCWCWCWVQATVATKTMSGRWTVDMTHSENYN